MPRAHRANRAKPAQNDRMKPMKIGIERDLNQQKLGFKMIYLIHKILVISLLSMDWLQQNV